MEKKQILLWNRRILHVQLLCTLIMQKTNWIDVYRWTPGMTEYFMWSNESAIGIGGGGNKFALYLFNEFSNGETDRCTTFNNMPLTTSSFHVSLLEIWGTIQLEETNQ